MKEKIKFEIDYLEYEINELRGCIEKEVYAFKEWIINHCNADDIANIPSTSQFSSIKSDVFLLRQLEEKKRWLLHLIKES